VCPGRETAPGFLLRGACRGVKLLEPRRSCMAPPSSQRKSIVPRLYFQWRRAEWRRGAMQFLIGRLRPAQAIRSKRPCFFPVLCRNNRLDCTPSLRHETRDWLRRKQLAAGAPSAMSWAPALGRLQRPPLRPELPAFHFGGTNPKFCKEINDRTNRIVPASRHDPPDLPIAPPVAVPAQNVTSGLTGEPVPPSTGSGANVIRAS
jgi:hypothetical protein